MTTPALPRSRVDREEDSWLGLPESVLREFRWWKVAVGIPWTDQAIGRREPGHVVDRHHGRMCAVRVHDPELESGVAEDVPGDQPSVCCPLRQHGRGAAARQLAKAGAVRANHED